MYAERLPDAAAFAARAEALLSADPVRTTALGSLLASALHSRERFADAVWLLVSDAEGNVVGAGAEAGFALMLSPMPEEAAVALAELAARELPGLYGVAGPLSVAPVFADTWQRYSGGTLTQHMATRLFRLDEVAARLRETPGSASNDGEPLRAHRDLFIDWFQDFVYEIEQQPARDAAANIDSLLGQDRLWVWSVDGRPVGFTSVTRPANGVVRLGLVYTPPALRSRGYATALVTTISRHLLAAGHLPVLFTDLANPTSNAIYQRIGYRPVLDSAEYLARH